MLLALKKRGDIPSYFSRRMLTRARRRAGCDCDGWAIDIGRHTYASTRHALGTTEAELAHDMGNSVTVLRSHYINRLVTRDVSAKCWRVLEAVEAKLARL